MDLTRISRRGFLSTSTAVGCSALLAKSIFAAETAYDLPPIRTITRGPRHHWFGYYDKLEFDPTSRYVLGMEVNFEHRSPRADDVTRIGMVDLADGDHWINLGWSSAWGWQQGCMLQWLPGSKSTVVWNDREDDHFVCRIHDTSSGKSRTIPAPIYTISPDGRTAICPDFRRLNDVRPGYGYAGVPDPHKDELTPAESGIWKIDLESGKQELLFSIADVARFGELPPDAKGKHWFNHLLFNPDGSRFVFLHRWRPVGEKTAFRTRMLTANASGDDLFVVDPSGETSHFIWRDRKHLLAWTRPTGMPPGFYLFKDKTEHVEPVGAGVMTENGHCTYLPGNEWILNDTYPNKQRLQHPYLFHVASGRRVPLGHFYSPDEYKGEWRCDTHPRFSPDGRLVVIDSPHTGAGRQLHLIDISGIVGKKSG